MRTVVRDTMGPLPRAPHARDLCQRRASGKLTQHRAGVTRC
ncbi:MAG: hypothetical protein QNJ85_03035 [Gammaproteobacteria bacterium]|nr:hypothetical protein [Gammaproteobacteria bacterium]